MKLAKGHLGKRKAIIQFNLPLPENERNLLEEVFFKIVENLKLEPEEIEFTKVKPPKFTYKKRIKEKEPEKEEEVKIDHEAAEKAFKEIMELLGEEN